MEGQIDLGVATEFVETAKVWFSDHVFVHTALVQAGVSLVLLLLAYFLARHIRAWVDEHFDHGTKSWPSRFTTSLRQLTFPLVWTGLQGLAVLVSVEAGLGYALFAIVLKLLVAWVVIRLGLLLVTQKTLANALAFFVWGIVALDILGFLQPTIVLLDAAAINIGKDLRISLLTIIESLITLAVLLWFAAFVSNLLIRRLQRTEGLTPAIQVLIGKLLKIVLFTIAILAGLNTLGIDLTALTVFGGAVGVGLGFGLQKVVSNFVSGLILLLDKSVKPGDVIAIGNTYGWINSLSGRYVSVLTRDGIEHLIPNEELITQRVENWSHTHNQVRQRASIGISYHSDPHKAIKLCLEAAAETERVLKDPAPVCLFTGFGDSSLDLELRFWINDPTHGIGNVKSAVLLKVWDKFKEGEIEIPFPQRDLHIKPAEGAIPVEIREPKKG
ncbi:MAG: mechanosensitive ion channel family protein [Alphaproteobacteria bacterium]